MNYDEQWMQMRFVQWLEWSKLPFHHSPNEGKRSPQEGNKNKRMGTSKGFPDMFIPVPSQDKHGLFIEFKSKNGALSPEQKEWMQKLNDYGYTAVVARSDVEAINLTNLYLGRQK